MNPGPLGLAIAFARTESALLTNALVDALSIIGDEKDDFLHYLYNRGVSATMTSFIDQAKLSIRAGRRNMSTAPIKVRFLDAPMAILKLLTPRFVRLVFIPGFHATKDALSIIMAPSINDGHSLNAPRVGADLRVTLEGADAPENIWLVGVSSYLRSALVSVIYQGPIGRCVVSSLARAK